MSVLSACNVYKIDNGHFAHIDGTVYRRSASDGVVYYSIKPGQNNLFSVLDTNTPFVGGLVKHLKLMDKIDVKDGDVKVVKVTEKAYPAYLQELLKEISG